MKNAKAESTLFEFGKEDGIRASAGSDTRKLAAASDEVLDAAVQALHRRHKKAVLAFGSTTAAGKFAVASADLPNHVDLYTKEQILDEVASRKAARKAAK